MTTEEIRRLARLAYSRTPFPDEDIPVLCDLVLSLRAEVAAHEATHDQQQAALAVEIARAEKAEAHVAELEGALGVLIEPDLRRRGPAVSGPDPVRDCEHALRSRLDTEHALLLAVIHAHKQTEARVDVLDGALGETLSALEWAEENELDPTPSFVCQALNRARAALEGKK